MSINVDAELAPLGTGRMLQADPNDISPAEMATAYAVLNFLEKEIDKRKKQLKPLLMLQAETGGDVDERGSQTLRLGDGERVIREFRQSSEPNEERLRALLDTYDIPLLDVFDEVKTVKMNASKLQYLVDVGKLKRDEVEGLRDESFALKVEPSPELKSLLRSTCSAITETRVSEKESRPRKPKK